jgi:hypothetical protein
VLVRILPPEVVNWVLRAASFGPPEMVAIFKAQVATVQQALDAAEAESHPLPWLSPEEVQSGEPTCAALGQVIGEDDVRNCLHNLFIGPQEVQAVAFLALVILRLGCAANAAAPSGET